METGRVTTASGVEIAYDVDGAGPDVVWLHGICEQRTTWTSITAQLTDELRCIRVDFQGHGESARLPKYDPDGYVEDVTAVVAATCAAPPIVVGHSLGGAVGAVASALGVAGAVMCVDQTLRDDHLLDVIRAVAPRLADPLQFADAIIEEKRALGIDLVPEPMLSVLVHLARTSDQQVVLDTWRPAIEADEETSRADDEAFERLLGAITTPFLSLHGQRVDDDYDDWLRARLRTARVEQWPEHGHWPHLVDPARFVERVRRFVHEAS